MTRTKTVPSLVLPEGLLWNAQTKSFEFVDIQACRFLRYDHLTGTISIVKTFKKNISWFFPCSDKVSYIIGLKDQIIIWNSKTDTQEVKSHLNLKPSQRFNDALCIEGEKIWFGVTGTLDNDHNNDGGLFSYSPENIKLEDENYLIPNGPLLTLNGKHLLHSDSLRGQVFCYEYENRKINPMSKRVVLDVSKSRGEPDGMCLDSDGNIYIAIWGLGEIWRLSPSLILLDKFPTPYRYVTNVAFGGNDLDHLLVTYAEDKSRNIEGGIHSLLGHNSFGIHSGVWKL